MLWLAGLMGLLAAGTVGVLEMSSPNETDASEDEAAGAQEDESTVDVSDTLNLQTAPTAADANATTDVEDDSADAAAASAPLKGDDGLDRSDVDEPDAAGDGPQVARPLADIGADETGDELTEEIIGDDAPPVIDPYGATDGDDDLSGAEASDSIFGGDGDDVLNGLDGADSLHGNDGSDVLNGGEGADSLFGHNGDDSLNGGAGDDSLQGSAGNDVVDGGDGDDAVHGGLDNDSLSGGAGADTLFGGWGNDLLNGVEDDPDTIVLDDSDDGDFLNGGGGDDTIIAGNDDVVTAGDGADSIVLGDWIADGEAASIIDFDAAEDNILLVYDDAGDVPTVTVQADPVMPSTMQVQLDGITVANVLNCDALNASDIVLMPESLADTVGLQAA